MKRKQSNETFFDCIDSEIKAYLLGFFIADGCICKNSGCTNSYSLSVALQEDDKYIINLFQQYIAPFNKISITNYQKGAKRRKSVCRIKWTSTYMKQCLEKYNIYPNKTFDFDFTLPFELIPSEYLWDFIRGFFDGDGHISYNDDNHTSTFAFYGTSKLFLEQIGNIFEKEFGVKKRIEGTVKTNITLYCLRFYANFHKKTFFKQLYEKMYNYKTYYLERKRIKIYKVFNVKIPC